MGQANEQGDDRLVQFLVLKFLLWVTWDWDQTASRFLIFLDPTLRIREGEGMLSISMLPV